MMPTAWNGTRTPSPTMMCRLLGHCYPQLGVLPAGALYFCQRCGKEMLDRPLSAALDLPPISDDVHALFDNEVQS